MKRTMFLAIIAIFLITTLTTAIASDNCDWNFFHGTAESQGYSSCGPGSAELTELWTFTANGRIDSPAVMSNGKVFFCDHSKSTPNASLHCLDLVTGKEIWKARMSGYGNYSAPAVYGGKVYSGCFAGYKPSEELFRGCKFYCFNALDGKELWKFDTKCPVMCSPVVVGSSVFFGTFDENNFVYCLDATSGAMKWKTKIGTVVYSSPICSNGKLYVSAFDGTIYCLNQETGAIIWKKYTANQRMILLKARLTKTERFILETLKDNCIVLMRILAMKSG